MRERLTGPFLLVLTMEQIPLLNDCIYEGLANSDGQDRPAMEAFRDDVQRQLDRGSDDLAALGRVRATGGGAYRLTW